MNPSEHGKVSSPTIQPALAGQRADVACVRAAALERTPLYIVTSATQRVGTTLVARLLAAFVRRQGQAFAALNINPNDVSSFGCIADAIDVDIENISDQVALFDQLLQPDNVVRIADVNSVSHGRFFSILREAAFLTEALRHRIEPVILFVTHDSADSAFAYSALVKQGLAVVPVNNRQIPAQAAPVAYKPTPRLPFAVAVPTMSRRIRMALHQSSLSRDDIYREPQHDNFELNESTRRVFQQFSHIQSFLYLDDLKRKLTRQMRRNWSD